MGESSEEKPRMEKLNKSSAHPVSADRMLVNPKGDSESAVKVTTPSAVALLATFSGPFSPKCTTSSASAPSSTSSSSTVTCTAVRGSISRPSCTMAISRNLL